MRLIKRPKPSKRVSTDSRNRVRKKLCKSTNTNAFGVSRLDLENINEVLRVHKTQIAEGKVAWKIVPKDSVEVLKERRKRQTESSQNERDAEHSSGTGKHSDDNEGKNTKRQKKVKIRAIKKKRVNHKRRKKRNSVSSSITTTTSNTISSCTCSSNMDY